MQIDDVNHYKYFFREVMRRTLEPMSDITFIFYLLFGIIIFGGLGLWIECVKLLVAEEPGSYQGILTTLSAFYPALIGAACLQLILESTGKSNKPMTVFAVGILLVTIISALLIGVFTFNGIYLEFNFWGTFALSVLGIWVWCVANADNRDLRTDPSAASGGSTSRALKGDISDFNAD